MLEAHVYQRRHVIAYLLPRTTDGSAMTGTDKDVLAVTGFRRKQGKSQTKEIGDMRQLVVIPHLADHLN